MQLFSLLQECDSDLVNAPQAFFLLNTYLFIYFLTAVIKIPASVVFDCGQLHNLRNGTNSFTRIGTN